MCRGFDAAGNDTGWGATARLVIDGTAPVVTLNPPVFGGPTSFQVHLSWVVSEAGAGLSAVGGAIEYAKCPLVSTCSGEADTIDNNTFTSNTLNFADCNPVKYAVRAIDLLGNVGAWQERIVRPAPDSPRGMFTSRP